MHHFSPPQVLGAVSRQGHVAEKSGAARTQCADSSGFCVRPRTTHTTTRCVVVCVRVVRGRTRVLLGTTSPSGSVLRRERLGPALGAHVLRREGPLGPALGTHDESSVRRGASGPPSPSRVRRRTAPTAGRRSAPWPEETEQSREEAQGAGRSARGRGLWPGVRRRSGVGGRFPDAGPPTRSCWYYYLRPSNAIVCTTL